MPFFTSDDIKVALTIICAVFGIGTLGMPSNFARAGPLFGTFAFVFMGYVNVYAATVCSKAMLHAPPKVQTFADLGEWCLGNKLGRYLVLVPQMCVCLFMPCVFLVLGSKLLTMIVTNAFNQSIWILLMTLAVLPSCLKTSMKNGSGASFALFSMAADVMAIVLLMRGMMGHPHVPPPEFDVEQTLGAFGNLSLAFGAAVIVPTLQKEHSDPKRMPRTVAATLTIVATLFFLLGILGYASVGCQVTGNLLFMIYPSEETNLTPLGFRTHRGVAVLACMCMQVQLMAALSIVIQPAFFMMEQWFLNMHIVSKQSADNLISSPVLEAAISYASCDAVLPQLSRSSNTELDTSLNRYKSVVMRLGVVACIVIIAITFRERLNPMMDFIGASCITLSCILLPIVMYLTKFWEGIPMWEKVTAIAILGICSLIGAYVTYLSGRQLFAPMGMEDVPFPFCPNEYKRRFYFDQSEM